MSAEQELTILTTSVGYGHFLPAWAASVAALTRRPAAVLIYTHGTAADSEAGAAAATTLRAAGFPVRHEHHDGRLPIAAAKNAAVGLTSTPWVMNLDADDVILPHALEDFAALAPTADIVAFGYQRTGMVRGKIAKGTRLYADAVGLAAVSRFYPASGNWPFRRTLWERRPYRVTLPGSWDTASLIEWGHLGARVKATKRPGFEYRRRDDSVLSRRMRERGWALAWTTRLIQQLHKGQGSADRGVSVLVPLAQEQQPERQAAWRHVRAWYAQHFPDWQIVPGTSSARQWQKGRAVGAALAAAKGDTLVIADADCLLANPADLRRAVEAVQSGKAPWAVPHRLVYRMSPTATTAILGGGALPAPLNSSLQRPAYQGIAGGGLLVVPRLVYVATGGIPDAFQGWGAEDDAVGTILDTLAGKHLRGTGDLVHLWHPPAESRLNTPGKLRNRQLLRQFRQCVNQPDHMLRLVQAVPMPPRAVFPPKPVRRYHVVARAR